MQVSKIGLIQVEAGSTHKIESMPYTFFSLDASERRGYNAFRKKQNNLEKIIDQIRSGGREIGEDEREKKEKEVGDMFIELIRPYIERSGLEAAGCFAYYGKKEETLVTTPPYLLFKNNEPFDVAIEVIYRFSMKDETLVCTSNLSYIAKYPPVQVFYDFLRKVFEERARDGTNLPITYLRGNGVYFASSDFAKPLIILVKALFENIGPEAIKELSALYRESMKNYGELSGTTVQPRVFKEAYERRLETELARAGFIEQ